MTISYPWAEPVEEVKMSGYKARVIDEALELDKRVSKLAAFLHDNAGVDPSELRLLQVQLEIMRAYAAVLIARLNLWGEMFPSRFARVVEGRPRCETCRYWSEMIARAYGGQPMEAFCLSQKSSFKQTYVVASNTCDAWEEGSRGAIDSPDNPTYL